MSLSLNMDDKIYLMMCLSISNDDRNKQDRKLGSAELYASSRNGALRVATESFGLIEDIYIQ